MLNIQAIYNAKVVIDGKMLILNGGYFAWVDRWNVHFPWRPFDISVLPWRHRFVSIDKRQFDPETKGQLRLF